MPGPAADLEIDAGGDADAYAGAGGRAAVFTRKPRKRPRGKFGGGRLGPKGSRGASSSSSSAAAVPREARSEEQRLAALPAAESALLARFWRAVAQLRRHGVIAHYSRQGRSDVYVAKVLMRGDAW